MFIDCDKCELRDVGCADCVVPVLLGEPPEETDISPARRRALRVLAEGGLIPPLRMTISVERAS